MCIGYDHRMFELMVNTVSTCKKAVISTAGKVVKYGVFSGPNTGKYRPENTPNFSRVLVKEITVNTIGSEHMKHIETCLNDYLIMMADPL